MKPGPFSGKTLGGKYLLGDLLGQGGFGAVYVAENQMLHRQQAVKVLLEEHFSDEKFRERFLREARTLGALDHANIVHVDDIGMDNTLIYLVMPYISGGTLQDIMKAQPGPVPLDVVTRYLEQICSALGYAHAQGVVHLDLKPLNLLVHQDGRLLLSDFGLAHLMEQGAIAGGTSLQFGSPLYMAPEHFEGKPGQSSDIYALGIILYQMLTGKHPFEGPTPAAIMRKHLTEPPPPLRQVRPDLPVALEAVMEKALAKQPEQRYGRAGELLVGFKMALAGQGVGQPSEAFPPASGPTPNPQQIYYDPTLRQSEPPGAPSFGVLGQGQGPMQPPRPASVPPGQPMMAPAPWPPAGPMAPPGYVLVPVLPPRPAAQKSGRMWTAGFTVAFVLASIGGGLLTLIGVVFDMVSPLGINPILADVISFLFGVGLAGAALVGIFSTRSVLLRLGFIAQVVAMACSMVASFLFFLASGHPFSDLSDTFTKAVLLYLPLAESLFQALSLALLSYGLARWQSRPDLALTGLQVGLTALIVVTMVVLVHFGPFTLVAYFDSVGLVWVAFAAGLLALLVLLLRPGTWRQQSTALIFLTIGMIFFLLTQGPAGALLFYLLFSPLPFLHQLSISVVDGLLYLPYLLSFALLICGMLLLGRKEHVRQPVQQAAAAPALAGQAVQ